MTVPVTVPAVFPIPPGYVLACPKCRKYKAYPYSLGEIPGYLCAWDKCGHFASDSEMQLYIGAEMVLE